jgi:hypothetical protein
VISSFEERFNDPAEPNVTALFAVNVVELESEPTPFHVSFPSLPTVESPIVTNPLKA